MPREFCRYCPKTFRNRAKLMQHMKEKIVMGYWSHGMPYIGSPEHRSHKGWSYDDESRPTLR